MKRVFFYIILLCVCVACTNKKSKYLSSEDLPEMLKNDTLILNYHVEIKDVFDDGSPQVVHFVYKKDTVIKVEKRYYLSGRVFWAGSLKNDKRNGLWTAWYGNGIVWSTGFYKDGINIGLSEAFYENGLLSCSKIYNDKGQLNGIVKYFSPAGELLAEIDYKNDTIISQKKYEIE